MRAAAGLARTGSTFDHGSGDFVVAFSTAHRVSHRPQSLTRREVILADEPKTMEWLFPAVVECVEEAVLNTLFCARTMEGRDGHTRHELPTEEVMNLLQG